MYSRATVADALDLAGEGRSALEISRALGISRRTVGAWLAGGTPRTFGRPSCERCNGPEHRFDALPRTYAYLLGLYLGDGCISTHARSVFRLRIVLDVKYPGIIDTTAAAMREIRRGPALTLRRPKNCVEVSSYWRAWPCLFPQHGPGKKHERPIALSGWQQVLVERWPDQLIRGLIESDGYRYQNTGRSWTCPRYGFDNKSPDIRSIFCHGCDLLGLHWTTAKSTIYVSRKADVAVLDSFIGPKR
jgi:hypothetical protein